MTGYLYAIGLSIAVLGMLFWLLRRRRIREKYVGIWLGLAAAVIGLGTVPSAAFWMAHLLGVQTPSNLLFAAAIVVLLAVCVQLSVELSSIEERVRTLAEELALLRNATEAPSSGPQAGERTRGSDADQGPEDPGPRSSSAPSWNEPSPDEDPSREE